MNGHYSALRASLILEVEKGHVSEKKALKISSGNSLEENNLIFA